jgi:hypothetical protein
MKDEYNRKKELDSKEHFESQKKMQEKPFSQRIKPIDAFNTIEEAYGEEGIVFAKKKPVRVPKAQVEHLAPFKPSNPAKKDCIGKTLDKYPDYLDDVKAKEDKNYGKPTKKKVVPESDRPKWKPNSFKQSTPSPSVTCNLKNIRSSLPAMMRR